MSVIYKPKGRALEYIPDGYALNIYNGCSFGCTYCYNRFTKNKEVKPLNNLIDRLYKEIEQYRGKKIFLSFLSDPFQPIERDYRLTRQVLEIFSNYAIIPVILTKGNIGCPDWRRMRAFKEIHFGVTLTFMNKTEFEPFAISPMERMENLVEAKRYGLTTWVSLEPVIDPQETLRIIERTEKYVDYYRVGAWNYDARAKDINYIGFIWDLQALPESIYKRIYLKDSLKCFL